jgi:hypothetical protein
MKMEYSTVKHALLTTSINLHYVTLFLLSFHGAYRHLEFQAYDLRTNDKLAFLLLAFLWYLRLNGPFILVFALLTTSINLHYVTLFLLSLHSAFYLN